MSDSLDYDLKKELRLFAEPSPMVAADNKDIGRCIQLCKLQSKTLPYIDELNSQFIYFRREFLDAIISGGVTIPVDLIHDKSSRIFEFIRYAGPRIIVQLLFPNIENINLVHRCLSLLIIIISLLKRKLLDLVDDESVSQFRDSSIFWVSRALRQVADEGTLYCCIIIMLKTTVQSVHTLALTLLGHIITISNSAARQLLQITSFSGYFGGGEYGPSGTTRSLKTGNMSSEVWNHGTCLSYLLSVCTIYVNKFSIMASFADVLIAVMRSQYAKDTGMDKVAEEIAKTAVYDNQASYAQGSLAAEVALARRRKAAKNAGQGLSINGLLLPPPERQPPQVKHIAEVADTQWATFKLLLAALAMSEAFYPAVESDSGAGPGKNRRSTKEVGSVSDDTPSFKQKQEVLRCHAQVLFAICVLAGNSRTVAMYLMDTPGADNRIRSAVIRFQRHIFCNYDPESEAMRVQMQNCLVLMDALHFEKMRLQMPTTTSVSATFSALASSKERKSITVNAPRASVLISSLQPMPRNSVVINAPRASIIVKPPSNSAGKSVVINAPRSSINISQFPPTSKRSMSVAIAVAGGASPSQLPRLDSLGSIQETSKSRADTVSLIKHLVKETSSVVKKDSKDKNMTEESPASTTPSPEYGTRHVIGNSTFAKAARFTPRKDESKARKKQISTDDDISVSTAKSNDFDVCDTSVDSLSTVSKSITSTTKSKSHRYQQQPQKVKVRSVKTWDDGHSGISGAGSSSSVSSAFFSFQQSMLPPPSLPEIAKTSRRQAPAELDVDQLKCFKAMVDEAAEKYRAGPGFFSLPQKERMKISSPLSPQDMETLFSSKMSKPKTHRPEKNNNAVGLLESKHKTKKSTEKASAKKSPSVAGSGDAGITTVSAFGADEDSSLNNNNSKKRDQPQQTEGKIASVFVDTEAIAAARVRFDSMLEGLKMEESPSLPTMFQSAQTYDYNIASWNKAEGASPRLPLHPPGIVMPRINYGALSSIY